MVMRMGKAEREGGGGRGEGGGGRGRERPSSSASAGEKLHKREATLVLAVLAVADALATLRLDARRRHALSWRRLPRAEASSSVVGALSSSVRVLSGGPLARCRYPLDRHGRGVRSRRRRGGRIPSGFYAVATRWRCVRALCDSCCRYCCTGTLLVPQLTLTLALPVSWLPLSRIVALTCLCEGAGRAL